LPSVNVPRPDATSATRCRDALNAGAPAWQPPKAPSYGLPIGHIGILVDCCGCGGQFGSAVCAAAPPIAHIFRHKQELDAELAGKQRDSEPQKEAEGELAIALCRDARDL